MPKKFHGLPGVCDIRPDSPLELHADDRRIEQAAKRWRSGLHKRLPLHRTTPPHGPKPGENAASPTIRIATDGHRTEHRDGYRLNVRPQGIELEGGSAAGCFHGLQTLTQLSIADRGQSVDSPERPIHNPSALPCCTVVDWPDFQTRGLLHDVTRGKVPTLETLELLVDRLALLKVNQLQVNIEHAFVFSFDPEICGPDDGLTPDEVRKLDNYCRERFINLVPALATFGHMGRILSRPRYRHLAEVETTKAWDRMSWSERMRGLTLDCMNPESHGLVERMWSDVLDAFSSPVVNICGDEPWDLGQGKNRGRFGSGGRGEAYLEHIRRTHAVCAARGRTTQFWSDVVRNYPHLLDRLPRDSTVLHWGYGDGADYEGTGTFVAAGLNTFVCPGTSGWKRIINAMDAAERNISTFAAAGRKHGGIGLVNTDWGDHGHFNLLTCSWHGIALGAALGWSVDHPIGDDFDERFARVVLGADDSRGVHLLRQASRVAERCETWPLLWMPLQAASRDPSLPSEDEAARAQQAAHQLRRWCQRAASTPEVDRRGLVELSLAARFSELCVDKLSLAHRAGSLARNAYDTRSDRNIWAEEVTRAADAYAECWHARNKPSGLDDVLQALSAACDDLRPE
ncbi:MAG: family 20 glycosylhydrolase [Phycisphaerales bacterium]|nr:MAG: family 20 glycosylhydrolase [Phycisphaerales bacterium]